MPHRAMIHEVDPRETIWASVGDLADIDVTYSNVLLGIYERPQKTRSGIILTDQNRDEDVWQGKVCLVLKVGPLAFADSDNVNFNGFKVEPGDWVVVWPGDGRNVSVNGKQCRLLSDTSIRMVVQDPDSVW